MRGKKEVELQIRTAGVKPDALQDCIPERIGKDVLSNDIAVAAVLDGKGGSPACGGPLALVGIRTLVREKITTVGDHEGAFTNGSNIHLGKIDLVENAFSDGKAD